jgi:hypothetical protein
MKAEQVKLPPPELKPFEILTKDQELQLEFLRINLAKKQVHKLEQMKKLSARREDDDMLSRESARAPQDTD